jgi:hypothetical protein
MNSSMVVAIALPVPYELYRVNWLSAGESRQLSTTLDVTSAVPFNEEPSRNDRATVNAFVPASRSNICQSLPGRLRNGSMMPGELQTSRRRRPLEFADDRDQLSSGRDVELIQLNFCSAGRSPRRAINRMLTFKRTVP